MRFPWFFVWETPPAPIPPPTMAGADALRRILTIGMLQIWCAMAATGQAQTVFNALTTVAMYRWTRKQLLEQPWIGELVRLGLPWVIAGDDPLALCRLDYSEETGEVFDDPALAVS